MEIKIEANLIKREREYSNNREKKESRFNKQHAKWLLQFKLYSIDYTNHVERRDVQNSYK